MGALVGRARELAEVHRKLFDEGARLVTLLGVGGMGKTSVARGVAEAAPCRSVFVDLSAVVDEAALGASVHAALGPAAAQVAVDDVGRAIAASGRLLLILDNFEQLTRAGAERSLPDWLLDAPELMMLVTSRQRLRVRDETPVELEPLSIDESVELFKLRSARVRSALDERDDDTIRELVRALDGLPLAIELAAARMRILSPSALLARLGDRFRLLRDTRAGDARHASLQSVLETSWELLEPEERSALAELSVLVAPFDLLAAEAVLGRASTLSIDLLESLHDASLLAVSFDTLGDGESRYSLLESVRAFAQTQSGMSERVSMATDRHAQHFLATAAALDEERAAPHGAGALDRLGFIAPELIAAFERMLPRDGALAARLCLSISPIAFSRGPLGEHLERVERCVARLDAQSQAVLVATLDYERGLALFYRSQFERAFEALSRAYSTALALDEPHLADAARTVLMLAAQWQGDRANVEALAGSAALDSTDAFVLFSATILALHRGEVDLASETVARAVALARNRPTKRELGRIVALAGLVAHERAELNRAEALFTEAASLLADASSPDLVAIRSLWHGNLSAERERYAEAVTLITAARDANADIGNVFFEAASAGYLGVTLALAGRYDEARAAFDASLPILRAHRDCYRLSIFLSFLVATLRATSTERSSENLDRELAALVADPINPNIPIVRALLEPLDDAPLIRTHLAHGRNAMAREAFAMLQRRGHEARRRGSTRERESSDVRLAAAMLSRVSTELAALVGEDSAPISSVMKPLLVSESMEWFEHEGSPRVDLSRRKPLQRLLRHLVQTRLETPGTPVPTDDLVRAGWPDERMLPASGAQRVYVALSTFRRMGLACLRRELGGFLLAGDVPLKVASG